MGICGFLILEMFPRRKKTTATVGIACGRVRINRWLRLTFIPGIRVPRGFYPRNQRAHKYIPKILAIRFDNAGVAHAETIVDSLLCCGVVSSVSFKSFVLRQLVIATAPRNWTAYKTAK